MNTSKAQRLLFCSVFLQPAFRGVHGSPGNWGCPLMAHFVESFVCLFILFYWERSCSVAQTGCGLVAIVPPQPECWDCVAVSHLAWRTMPWGTLHVWTCLVIMRVDGKDFLKEFLLHLFIYSFTVHVVCLCMHTHVPWPACGGQRTISEPGSHLLLQCGFWELNCNCHLW